MTRACRLMNFALALSLVSAPGALAETHEDEPTFATEESFVHCSGEHRVGNVGYARDGVLPTWSTTRPVGTFGPEAGCGWVDPWSAKSPTTTSELHPTFRGAFTGNVRAVTFRIHASCKMLFAPTGTPQAMVYVALSVDGAPVIGTAEDPWVGVHVDATMLQDAAARSVARLTVVDLPAELGRERGDGVITRTFQFSIDVPAQLFGVPSGCMWLYDAADTATSVTFNPEWPTGRVLKGSG